MSLASIFSASTLLRESSDSSIKTFQVSTDVDFYTEAMGFVMESNQAYFNNACILYKSILESKNDPHVIHEGFSDFIDWIRKIIKKAIDFVKRLFDKFVLFLNKLVKTDSYIKKHKDKLSKFTSDDNFDYTGYQFTIKTDLPKINDLKTELEKNDFKAAISSKEMDKEYNKLVATLEGDYYDNMRGKLLGTNQSISETDFDKELFSVFRNGTTDTTEFTIDKATVDQCLKELEDTKALKDSIESSKKRLIETLSKLETSFSKGVGILNSQGSYNVTIPPDQETSATVGANDIHIVDLFVKAKATQVKKVSDICVMVYAAKLNAVKDRYKQNKDIVYKALSKVVKVF